MMKLFAGLFVLFFIIPYLLRSLLRFLFGSKTQQNRASQASRNTSSHTQKPPKKKKFFSKNEGEYVDYEVIKD